MRKQKRGHIFQVSSVGGRLGVPGNTPYHAAKWAVGGFSDSLAMEVAPFGSRSASWSREAFEPIGHGALVRMPDLLPEYEASVGPMLKILRSLEGRAEGDSFPKAELIESSGDKAREKRPLLKLPKWHCHICGNVLVLWHRLCQVKHHMGQSTITFPVHRP